MFIQDQQTPQTPEAGPPAITKLSETDAQGQLPIGASNFVEDFDGLFYFTMWTCIFFFVLILVILLYSVVKYRRKTIDQPAASNVTHNTTLEVVWTVIPLIIVMVIFAWGWKGSLDMQVAPADAMPIKVQAKQWNWTFTHHADTVASPNEFWCVIDRPVKLEMYSTDVLHSFFLPNMRQKRDVLPGRYQILWFTPTRMGSYRFFCTEYCGDKHSEMNGICHVVTQAEYDERPWDVWDPDQPLAMGERYYSGYCGSCHSLDGSPMTGPSFLNLSQSWGQKKQVAVFASARDSNPENVEITIDEEYVRESMRKPQAKTALKDDGSPWAYSGMAVHGEDMVPDDRISVIFEFIKSIKDRS